jgi:hypothetical protein
MGKLTIKQFEQLEGRRKQYKKAYNRVTFNRKNTKIPSYTIEVIGDYHFNRSLALESDILIIQAIKKQYEALDIPFDVSLLSPTRNEKAAIFVESLSSYVSQTAEDKIDSFVQSTFDKSSAFSRVYEEYFTEFGLHFSWEPEIEDYKGGNIPLMELLNELNLEYAKKLQESISLELHLISFFHKIDSDDDELVEHMKAYPVAVMLYDNEYLRKLSSYSSNPKKTFECFVNLQKPEIK